MADNVTTQELEDALVSVLEIAGSDSKEYIDGLDLANHTDLQAAKDELLVLINQNSGLLESILETDPDNDSVSIQELLNSLKALLSDDNGLVDVLTKIQENSDAVNAAKAELQGNIDTVSSDVADTKNSITTINNSVADIQADIDDIKENGVEASQETLDAIAALDESVKGITGYTDEDGNEVVGSLETAVTAERDRAKNVSGATVDLQTEDKSNLVAAINEVKSGSDNTASQVSGLTSSIADINNQLEDTTDDDDNLVKGIKTRLTDAEGAVAQEVTDRTAAVQAAKDEVKTYVDDNVLKAGSMDFTKIRNGFRRGITLPEVSNDDNDGDGESV